MRVKQALTDAASVTSSATNYNRVFDFDGEGFRAIRRRAAPILDVLDDVFDPDVLRRLLPDPEESRDYGDAFGGSAGFKSILGLALLRHELMLPAREVRDISTRG